MLPGALEEVVLPGSFCVEDGADGADGAVVPEPPGLWLFPVFPAGFGFSGFAFDVFPVLFPAVFVPELPDGSAAVVFSGVGAAVVCPFTSDGDLSVIIAPPFPGDWLPADELPPGVRPFPVPLSVLSFVFPGSS